MNPYKLNSGFNIRTFVITLSVVFLISYGVFNARHLIMGPEIEIFGPTDQSETFDNTILVKGRVKNMTFLSLNERPIFVDKEGLFEEKLLLSPGFNIIEIRAKDRFKQEDKQMIKVYYKEGATTTSKVGEYN